jgi:hypothetical protein
VISIGIILGVLALGALWCSASQSGGIVINHENTDITAVPQASMEAAKRLLHIGYGHTSHGSQLTTGMQGLVAFANGGGRGLSLPKDFFAFNNGGADGALDLEEGDSYEDGQLDHDCGYYPNWVDKTRAYLDDDSHSDVNVIIWSWCGQVSGKHTAGTLSKEYIEPMVQLEADYPNVRFVYMTGHLDHGQDAANKAANQMIRDHCAANGKILFDFMDIECYDPDGKFFEFPSDNCDYYASATGEKLGNWAIEWQESHTEGVDWYTCEAAHSEPLNANRKAYAAWALWAALAETLS